jgi:CRISPR system Cascade subunit CasA
MHNKKFNLLQEPWILAMKQDGAYQEVSLLEVFKHAHSWQRLAGELPAQDIAVLRLLLAILHAVFARYNLNGDYAPLSSPDAALKRWKALLDMGKFPIKVIEDYLLHFQDRFWLFHPKHPFYQVVTLDKATKYTAAKLNGEISESENKVRLFPQRTGKGKGALRYPEAARWLLYINAFDDASIKPQQKGLPSTGIGWLGKIGPVTATGDNLFQTLLLNLVFLENGENKLWGKEMPVWELPVKADERTLIPVPDNLSSLLTLQSRRLLLKCEGDLVIGVIMIGGDFFPVENSFAEQMTAWRYATKRKTGRPEYLPVRHDPARQIWRNFSALLAQSGRWRRPGVVSWLARLKEDKLIPHSHFSFQTAAIKYDSKNCSIEDVFSDSISFNAGLLTSLGSDWVMRIIDEIETTDRLVQRIGKLAQDLAKAAGDANGKGRADASKEQAYFQLDLPFRQWLHNIDPTRDDPSITCDKWWKQARQIVLNLGKTLVEQAGARAFSGRTITEKKKELHFSSPQVFNRFLYYTSTREALKGGVGSVKKGKTG